MEILQQQHRRLIQTLVLGVFATLLSSILAFGQPMPPPEPIATVNLWVLESISCPDRFGNPADAAVNVTTAPSWDYAGTALSIDSVLPSYVQEPFFRGVHSNMDFLTGAFSVWLQPNWTSTTDGGTGPAVSWAPVISVGNWTSNASESAWTVAVSPQGTNLVMEAQSGGSNQVIFNVPIDFDAGDWHALTISYGPTNCSAFLDNELVSNAPPIHNFPSASDCTNYGIFIGSLSTSGICQFHGQLQWLATYDYPLSADEVADDYADVAAYITSFGYNVPGSGGRYSDDSPPFPGGGYTNGSTNTFTNDFRSPVYTTNSPIAYDSYTNLWLSITNDSSNCYVTAESTLSNLTYLILTNAELSTTNWGIWEVLLATSNVTPAPPLALGSNTLFFEAVMVGSTGTNGIDDWWCMEYFGTLNVNPYADPDGDGLCNLDEYLLGTNPTNAYSISTNHTDAQALLLAYTNYDSHCTYQLFVTNGANTNTVLVTMTPTLVGTNYQIYSHQQCDTNNTWIVETNFLGTNTSTTVAICLNGRSLDFIGGYGEDSDGDGLPDGYEVLATLTDPYLPDTGLSGTPDGYKDPDGDGYSNLV